MKKFKHAQDRLSLFCICCSLLAFLILPNYIVAQEHNPLPSRDTLISAAGKIINASKTCVLFTNTKTNSPHCRLMDPFPPEKDMTIFLGTNALSRKVKEIRKDSIVLLFYQDPDLSGYVSIKGYAKILNDNDLKKKYWKEAWNSFYPDKEKDYLLIKVVPAEIEVLSMKYGIFGDPLTWKVQKIVF